MSVPRVAWLLVAGILLWSTNALGSSGRTDRQLRRGAFAEALPALNSEQIRHPGDAGARRQLGWALLETGNLAGAREQFEAAARLEPANASGQYFLGRTADQMGDTLQAIAAYEAFLAASPGREAKERSAVSARHAELTRASMAAAVRRSIQSESTLSVAAIPPSTWIVPDFYTVQSSDTARALSKGLAVILTTDLVSIPGVRVLERRRVGVLLNELALHAQPIGPSAGPDLALPVSVANAPRLGKLLGARRIAQGALDATPKADVRLDLAAFDVVADSVEQQIQSQPGSLENVLRLERAMVLGLADHYGWKLDRTLRRRFGQPATVSFPAFLAFGLGVDHEDAGRFAQAAESYRRAMELDPKFTEARERAETLGNLGTDLRLEDALIGARLLGPPGDSDRASRSAAEVGPTAHTQSWDPRLGAPEKTGLFGMTISGSLP